MNPLLTTPEQHGFQDPTVELNEKKLRRWLTGLPVLNAAESLRQVLGALEPLNEQQLAVDKRLALLLIYQATFQRLYAAAEPMRLRQQPLSREQRQQTVDDVEALSLAMANGFKLALKGLYAQGERRDRQTFGRVLRWTLQALVAALLHSYRFYRPEPAFVFLELNQVYRLARHHGLHETTDSDDQDAAQNSLAETYQAVCLLALSDPFSQPEGAVDNCYRALLRYVDGTRVVPGNSWQGVPEGLYFVDLKSDSRPRHCVRLESPVPGDDPYIIDARGTLQRMHKTLLELPADRRRQRAEAIVLKALLPEVAVRDQRRSERRRDGRWIGLVTGLEAITGWLRARARGETPRITQWRVKDASASGYCLAWDKSSASELQVGALVGVIADNGGAPQPLQLMVVRWVRDAREQGTELGVERVDGVPGLVRVRGVDDAAAAVRPALFMPSDAGRTVPARLVAPPQVYRSNRGLVVYVGEREVAIRCGTLIEQAPGFDCFDFTSDG